MKSIEATYRRFSRAEWIAVSVCMCVGLAFIGVVSYLAASEERKKEVVEAKEEIEKWSTELNKGMSAAISTTRALAALVFANLRNLSDIPNHNGT